MLRFVPLVFWIAARSSLECTCHRDGVMSCSFLDDSFALNIAECRASATTLVWLSPNCVANLKVGP